jgi:hypothetical protein
MNDEIERILNKVTIRLRFSGTVSETGLMFLADIVPDL